MLDNVPEKHQAFMHATSLGRPVLRLLQRSHLGLTFALLKAERTIR